MMRLHGQFMPIDPRVWNTGMDMTVNVGVGTGQEGERHAALTQALTLQMQVWTQYGSGNGMVTMTGIRNTLADMLALQGIRNADRYFNPMTPEMEQQLVQQQQQQAQENPQMTDGEALLQAEQYKADKAAEMNMIKLQIDAQKALAVDDRERDALDQELMIKVAEILGKYGTSVDTATIKAAQQTPRYPAESPAQAVTGGRF